MAVDDVWPEAVTGMLDCKWSPEQISHALGQRFAEDPSRQLSHESVYQALYDRDRPLGDRGAGHCARDGVDAVLVGAARRARPTACAT